MRYSQRSSPVVGAFHDLSLMGAYKLAVGQAAGAAAGAAAVAQVANGVANATETISRMAKVMIKIKDILEKMIPILEKIQALVEKIGEIISLVKKLDASRESSEEDANKMAMPSMYSLVCSSIQTTYMCSSLQLMVLRT